MKIKYVFLVCVLLSPISGWAAGPFDVVGFIGRSLLRSSAPVFKESSQGVAGNLVHLRSGRFAQTQEEIIDLTQHSFHQAAIHFATHTQPPYVSFERTRGGIRGGKSQKRIRELLERVPPEDPLLRYFVDTFGSKDQVYASALKRMPTLLAVTTESKVKQISLSYGSHYINLGEACPLDIVRYQTFLPGTSTCLKDLFEKQKGFSLLMRFIIDSPSEEVQSDKLVLMPVPIPSSNNLKVHGNLLLLNKPWQFSPQRWDRDWPSLYYQFNYLGG